eukprot:CAMPEP_0194280208 /NCGR_PEP_ID=MMETSP0169-20130528/16309_1 /TAXON_ID=218684 /ORGANISM="Corethron pennatum, Strain L29A3" /LENGTH=238 /DNA_ID=CAMNT_0039024847 /DNA_START=62 /DNA_END=775 /DNA_ORIENTATION=-
MRTICLAVAASYTFRSSFALAASQSLELKYFGARGAAETARVILALVDAEYKDSRYEILPGMKVPDFAAAKESGELDANLGRAPLLLVDGLPIGQSAAIERFLAKKFGLFGNSDVEAAQIDCISEHCRDVKDAAAKKGFGAFTRDKTDEEKSVARKEWFGSDLPVMLEKVDKAVQLTSEKDGYAVGGGNSYADVAIFSLLRDPSMQADQEDLRTASEKCSVLTAIADRIAKEETVARW